MNPRAKPAGPHRPSNTRNLIAAALIPLAAFGVQWFFWGAIQPYVWFLFFPAVFLSSWTGGLRGGLMATLISTGLVWYFFIPPQFSFAVQSPMALVSIGMFVGMGVLFSLFHGRLRKANKTLVDFKAALDEHAIVAITDAQGKITYVNDSFCAISKYPRAELLGQDHRVINSGYHPKAFFQEMWETIISGQVWKGEIKSRAKDGAIYWLNTTIVPFLDADGKPTQYIAIRTDITERKQAELAIQQLNETLEQRVRERTAELEQAGLAMRESETRFRLMVEGVTDYAIIMLDADGHVTSWNEGARHIKGYTADEIVGQHFSRFYPKEDVKHGKPQQELETAAAKGRFENEGWRVRKDGSQFIANVIITALRDDTGRLRGFVKVTRDITERKQAEEKIRALNAGLERRVQERTAQLTTINQELEAFFYSVSHDLRAPLRHIDGFAQLLRKNIWEQADAKARRHLDTITDSIRQMGRLIDDLLAFSRMGRAEMRHLPLNMNALVDEARTNFHEEIDGRQITWQVSPLPEGMADPTMLRQVWINLIGNAVKYTRGRTEARIEVESREEEDEWIYCVRDNGAGFDMRYAGKLFGVFQRLHRDDQFEGTGVGLASVRRIIQRHGGRTWAEGELDRGARFYFSLPKRAPSLLAEQDDPQKPADQPKNKPQE